MRTLIEEKEEAASLASCANSAGVVLGWTRRVCGSRERTCICEHDNGGGAYLDNLRRRFRAATLVGAPCSGTISVVVVTSSTARRYTVCSLVLMR
jgi:hypothetical protein